MSGGFHPDCESPAGDSGGSTWPEGLLSGRPWQPLAAAAPGVIERLRRDLPLSFPVSDRLLAVLAGRGLRDAPDLERFFFPSLDHLPDPFLLPEMDRAVSRLCAAVEGGERVSVHGDFDVDGITGSALLAFLLQNLSRDGRRIALEPVFVPDRARDGYGVAERMIRHWGAAGVTLLVTVDTGAAAGAEISLARDLGLDVVVLDHHLYQERPCATALVNPCHPESRYPHSDLCGVSVAFKLAQAMQQAVPAWLPAGFLTSVLDLVALGVVADQMPLVGENRVLVRKGLEQMRDRQQLRPGLAALLAVAGLDHGFPLTAGDLAYQLAPRLNACGRIGRVETALDLMLTGQAEAAQALAREADRTNQERRQADQLLTESALTMAKPFLARGDRGLVLASPDWHEGIIGIGASRLVEQFKVPTILIAVTGEEARGSARSVPDIDVKAVLDRCASLLPRYGGHAQAAGMTLHAQDVPALREAFLAVLATAPPGEPVPEVYDLDLPLAEMSAGEVAELVSELEQLEPFGAGNRRPVFRCSGLRLLRPPQPLGNGAHLRFAFRSAADGPTVGRPAALREFVSFGSGDAWRRWLANRAGTETDLLSVSWEILFQLNRNTYRPRRGRYDPVQQLLVDLRPTGES